MTRADGVATRSHLSSFRQTSSFFYAVQLSPRGDDFIGLPNERLLPLVLGLSQHQIHDDLGVLDGIVRLLLYLPVEHPARQSLEAVTIRQTEVMREHHTSVDNVLVDQTQGPEIVPETVAHQNRLGVDKIEKVVLHLWERLGDADHNFLRDAAEFRVVVNYLGARLDERVIYDLAV